MHVAERGVQAISVYCPRTHVSSQPAQLFLRLAHCSTTSCAPCCLTKLRLLGFACMAACDVYPAAGAQKTQRSGGSPG